MNLSFVSSEYIYNLINYRSYLGITKVKTYISSSVLECHPSRQQRTLDKTSLW